MTRRIIDREYAIEECSEVCQDINTRDRNEMRQRNSANCGCERRNCEMDTTEVIRRRNIGNRTSGQECEVEDITPCCEYDPCRWNRCGCQNRYCGYNRRGCGCTRGLNCDRNRRLRTCRCECED